jgi:hypothetical protein
MVLEILSRPHGKYPQSWAEGYISVIHKSGDAADPNNYRGITITLYMFFMIL